MAQILPLQVPFFRTPHLVIDDYLAAMGPTAYAVYSVLQRHANYATGECWPSVKTIATKVGIGVPRARKALKHLERLGLIDVPLGAPSSRNRYTVHDATQTAAVAYRQWERDGDCAHERVQNALPIVPEISPQPLAAEVVAANPEHPEQDPEEQELLREKKESTRGVLFCEEEKKTEATDQVTAPTADHAATLTIGAPCTTPAHQHSEPFPGLRYCSQCWRHWPVPLVEQPPVPAPRPLPWPLPPEPVGLRIVPQRQPLKAFGRGSGDAPRQAPVEGGHPPGHSRRESTAPWRAVGHPYTPARHPQST